MGKGTEDGVRCPTERIHPDMELRDHENKRGGGVERIGQPGAAAELIGTAVQYPEVGVALVPGDRPLDVVDTQGEMRPPRPSRSVDAVPAGCHGALTPGAPEPHAVAP